MGSNASYFLVLTPTGKPFFWPGETVSGHVVLEVQNSIKTSSILFSLCGQRITKTYGSRESGPRVEVKLIVYLEHDLHIPMGNGIFYNKVSNWCLSKTLSNDSKRMSTEIRTKDFMTVFPLMLNENFFYRISDFDAVKL